MLSVIAGALIFAAMTYIGVLVKNQYALRLKMMKYMSEFSNFMLREITLYKTPIEMVINKFISLKENDKEKIMINYLELKTDKSYEKIYELTDYIYLKKNDRQIISDFLINMGKGNLREEKKFLEQFIRDIEIIKGEASAQLDKDGKLASQLLALIGIALMIIVV